MMQSNLGRQIDRSDGLDSTALKKILKNKK